MRSMRRLTGLVLLSLLACGGDEEPVNPMDAVALSQVLVIPDGVRKVGNPPAPSGLPDAPVVMKSVESLAVDSGSQVVLPLTFTSVKGGFREVYVQVQGANDHLVVKQQQAVTAGTIMLPVSVPRTVQSGSFVLTVSVAGPDGSVSNVVMTPVVVTRRQGGQVGNPGGDVICASSDPMAGETSMCPDGKLLDFCISTKTGACYYTVGGVKIDCGNCQTDQTAIQMCAQQVAMACQ